MKEANVFVAFEAPEATAGCAEAEVEVPPNVSAAVVGGFAFAMDTEPNVGGGLNENGVLFVLEDPNPENPANLGTVGAWSGRRR